MIRDPHCMLWQTASNPLIGRAKEEGGFHWYKEKSDGDWKKVDECPFGCGRLF